MVAPVYKRDFTNGRMRELPHDDYAEGSVIATLLTCEGSFHQVGDLHSSDFFQIKLARIFAAIEQAQHHVGKHDLVTVRAQLERSGHLEEVGGVVELFGIADEKFATTDATWHARLVREAAAERRSILAGQAMAARLQAGENPTDVLADVQEQLHGSEETRITPITKSWGPLRPGLLSATPPPRKWLFRHPDRDGVPVDDRHGEGMLPLGKVELFASAGGVGKTMALIEAAVAVITGRRWFGHFDVDQAVAGDVLLVLGEEDDEEVHRRLYTVAQALELTDGECREVERRLVVLPFAGVRCVVAAGSSDAELRQTDVIDEFLRKMAGRQWSLVVFDPLSRFAGVPIDVDNANATFVVQQFERLAIATGAAVLVSHHTNRESRKQGRADPRGATAIEDGVRWVATLVAADDVVKFLQTKSNYSRPMREQDAVVLTRARGGRLRVQTAAERAVDNDVNTTEQDVDAVVAALRELGGRCRTASAIVKQSGVRKQDGLAAVDIAVAKGLILWEPKSAPERKRDYLLPSDDGARTHPRTPGNREPGFPGPAGREPGQVPGTVGTEREPGTKRGRRDLD